MMIKRNHGWMLGSLGAAASVAFGGACSSSDEAGGLGVSRESIAGVWSQPNYIKASNTGIADLFGSVGISGDGLTLVAGARLEDSDATGINGDQSSNIRSNSGAVYVVARTGNAGSTGSGGGTGTGGKGTGGSGGGVDTWTHTTYVKASNTGADDYFGHSVAISSDGNTIAVGAPREDGNATTIDGPNNNLAQDAGAVFVFVRSGPSWVQQAYVKPTNVRATDEFGTVVALSADGNTLAVGAPREDGPGDFIFDSGSAFVFTRSGGVWSEQAYVRAANAQNYDGFGKALALSSTGDTLAVGAPAEDSNATNINGDGTNNSAVEAGAAYVFSRQPGGTTWSQEAYVKPSNAETLDAFGTAVSLSGDGNRLVVGAPNEDSDATGIGGPSGNNAAADSGAAYVFTRTTGWAETAYVKASNTQTIDWFGTTAVLSSDGNNLAIAAPGEDSGASGVNGIQANESISAAGAVYVFRWSGSAWLQHSYVKASNPGASDYFGERLALSSDANRIAVGSTGEDSNCIGANSGLFCQLNNDGANSGAAYVYRGLP
jgi:hypothetical protein